MFDNAEDSNLLLKYWPPACSSRYILVTSQNHNLHFGPAKDRFEVESFDHDKGSRLLLLLLRMDIMKGLSITKAHSTLQLSEELAGHALAISFIARLIHRNRFSIEKFIEKYEKTKNEIHSSQNPNKLSAV